MESAVLVEVGRYRSHIYVLGVVADNLQLVGAFLQGLSDIDHERGISTHVGSHLLTVHLDYGSLGGSFEQEEMRFLDILRLELAAINSFSPVI